MIAKVRRLGSNTAANGWAAPLAADRFGVGFGRVALASAPPALRQCVDRCAPLLFRSSSRHQREGISSLGMLPPVAHNRVRFQCIQALAFTVDLWLVARTRVGRRGVVGEFEPRGSE